MKTTLMAGAALCALTLSTPALAQHEHHNHHDHAQRQSAHVHFGNTPTSIMGDHVHDKGEWMFSYSFMQMGMKDNRDGTSDLSPADISGDVINTSGSGPATMRIVPLEMTMDMHMLGAMYGVTDRLTLMAMGHYLDNDMQHVTYAMGNPDLEVGRFTTRSQGWGDTKLSALYDLTPKQPYSIVAKAGLSIPTGSIKQRDGIINPMGASANIRLPYGMQLGSGTYDLEPAITYSQESGLYNWGAQYAGQIRLGENSQDYTLGDKHKLTAWGGYQFTPMLGGTLRVTGEHEAKIDGRDTVITGPVQTADPNNYGGNRIEIGVGFNITPQTPAWRNHSIGVEGSLPVYQDLNGPQLKRDYGLAARYRYSF